MPDTLPAAVAGKLTVEKALLMFRLLAEDLSCMADTIDVLWCGLGCIQELKQRRDPVFKTRERVGGLASGDVSLPRDDGRNPYSAFVQRAFAAAQSTCRVKVICVRTAQLVVERSVIGCEHKDRVLFEAEALDRIDDLADVFVELTDHRGVGCAWILVWQIGLPTDVGRVGAMFANLCFGGIRGSLEREVRDSGRDVAEERLVFVGFNPVAGFPGDAFRGVLIADKAIV